LTRPGSWHRFAEKSLDGDCVGSMFRQLSNQKGQAMQRFAKFVRDESATTAVEYSIMLGFIMLVLIGAVAIFGVGQGGKWNGIWGQMNAHGM